MKHAVKTALAAAILGGAVEAGAASHFKALFIEQYDRDGDGALASVEFEAARRERFDLTDVDGNGTVDPDEYLLEWENRMDAQLQRDRKAQMGLLERRFPALDKDGDGRIDAAEFGASGERAFAHVDRNGDGVLDAVDAPEEDERDARRDGMTRDEALARVRRILGVPSTHELDGMLALYDDDGDGSLSREAFDAARERQFAGIDGNGDGGLDADEYRLDFEQRLDREIAGDRKAQVRQTGVRFDALDKDGNGAMTFAEYQRSGHRSFKRWDTDGDGYVTWEEADPAPRRAASDSDGDSDDSSDDASGDD